MSEVAAEDVLAAIVAGGQPLPLELLGAIFPGDADALAVALDELHHADRIAWTGHGQVIATDPGRARSPLTPPQRLRWRAALGRAARAAGGVDPVIVTGWLLDGARLDPHPGVATEVVALADRSLTAGRAEQAADVLVQLVERIDQGLAVDDASRLHACTRLAYLLRWTGQAERARQLGRDALAQARASRDALALATVAVAWRPDAIAISDDPTGAALIGDALDRLPPGHAELRTRLLAARADAQLFTDLDACRRDAEEAWRLARTVDDAETAILAAYAHRLAHWSPARQDEALELGSVMVALAARAVDFVEYGAVTRLQVFLELGDWPHLDAELEAMSSRLADAPRPAELVWWLALRAARAQTRGDWPAARHATERALALAGGSEYGAAFQLLMTQLLLLDWHAGADLRPLVADDLLPAGPMRRSWEACLLGWTCEQRPRAEVLAALDRLLDGGVEQAVRRDLTFGPVISSLAIAAAQARAVNHAAAIAEVITPFAGQWAGTGGAVVNGPYALHLGRLLGVLGRNGQAHEQLEAALESCRLGGCAPWEARTELALAELHAGRPEGRRHATRAAALAEACGMAAVLREALTRAGRAPLPQGLSRREAEVLRLIAGGATNTEIAATLYLSVKTVERHILNAYRKAGVRNRAEAVAFAVRELTDPIA
ncbi:MAG: helix-turn-helix transcriptional regulator [Acidimicrobiales bacterium]